MPDPTPPNPPTEIADPIARKDQIWEQVKKDTEKFIADAAVLIMGGHSIALVADQFAGMAVRSHPAHISSIMATLLVMTAKDRLEAQGLLPEMPPDPFTQGPGEEKTEHERVTAFLDELTALSMRHGLAVNTTAQQVHALCTVGPLTGSLDYPALACEVTWSPALGRYSCESTDRTDPSTPDWTVP